MLEEFPVHLSLEEVKAWSGVLAALVAFMSAIFQYFLVRQKEWKFEKERQAFQTKLKESERKAIEELERSRQEFQAQLEVQRQQHELTRAIQQERIESRVRAVTELRRALRVQFDSFDRLILDASKPDDHSVLFSLGQCLEAMSSLDEKIKGADEVARGRTERARLHRLRVMKRYFLGLILDLTRPRSERLAREDELSKKRQRLSRRRDVAMRHIELILEVVSRPSDA